MTTSQKTILVGGVALLVGFFAGSASTAAYRSMHTMTEMMQTMHTNQVNMHMNTAMDHSMHEMDHSSMDMHSMMEAMTKNLEGKTGAAFDKAFIDDMIPHHQGAVEMAELVLTSTDRPELKKLAQEIINAQTKEIKMMQEWQKEWFTATTN